MLALPGSKKSNGDRKGLPQIVQNKQKTLWGKPNLNPYLQLQHIDKTRLDRNIKAKLVEESTEEDLCDFEINKVRPQKVLLSRKDKSDFIKIKIFSM
jgi:hypothetical protein